MNEPARGYAGRVFVLFLIALLAAGCGNNGRPSQEDSIAQARDREGIRYPKSQTVRGQSQSKITVSGPIPTDAHLKGVWSPVVDWPLITVHVVLLPDGRVLSYGSDGEGTQTGYFIYDVWSPAAGFGPESHLTLPNNTLTDLFCGSQVLLPQAGAGVFLAGGDNWAGYNTANTPNNNTNIFNYSDNSLTRATTNLQLPRWYATSTVLANGEIYIQGGTGGTERPEVRGVGGTFRLLSGANTSEFDFYYPHNFVAPDGRVFGYDSYGAMYYVDPSGSGSISSAGWLDFEYTGHDATAAMFRPGRILQFGGNSNGAAVIDITGTGPVVTPTQSLSSQRRLVNATILANGQVLATGGSREWNELVGVNKIAEIWNPATGTWTQGASGALARLYHSNALLLPDATVLVSGGGAWGPLNNLNAEIYHPPYLFTSGGVIAQRPRIVTAPSTLQVGQNFQLTYADAPSISRVVLVKNGSATHGFNMEQRFAELSFSSTGTQLTVQMTSRATDTPPGYYMLFVLNAAGVPSEAKIVWINIAGAVSQHAPTITNPGNKTGVVGTAVSLAIQASDVDGDPLTYSATGLPPGLSINTSTGLVSGTPSTAGSYNTVVSVTDGTASASANFTWTISSNVALALDPLATPTPAQTGTDVTFTASANRTDAQFSWNFGDGTSSPYSPSGSVTHRFSSGGLFFVTVTATDSSGAAVTQTFMQIVHLPLSASRPSVSSNIVFERRSGAAPRVWMVNQDNDSVSVFDAVNGAKISEVTVGEAPRSLAIDGAGRIWVTNKRATSVSVVDPVTLAVSTTISLPLASQPHGIAMSPAGDFAYVVLEATGQVQKYQTSTFALVATGQAGPNARQVSVSADGATLWVSRFITPPQGGESGQVVQTTGGGEVVKLNASSMSAAGTVLLRFSQQSDSEATGRGVPNYLGAVVLSPDASQAWVPSKQDNIQRGKLRDGLDLNFQNTVRAISSRIDLATSAEDRAARIDHDNASAASAAAFDPLGVLLFVALETSREVAVVDAHRRVQLFRFQVGFAPQGVAVSDDGTTVYVNNFMSRSLGVYDLQALLELGQLKVDPIATVNSVASEKLTPQVLLGKKLFYDAFDPRLARDRYMSCASCHNDGGQDGRVWDLTGFGEGLRNTIALRGRAGMGQGFLHWSNNFDEVQDFEGQIRALAGGTGLMSDADFSTRTQPLGTPVKAGRSTDLDALAAYVTSLAQFEASPFRSSSGALTSQGSAGRTVFSNKGCAGCHGGTAFTNSGANTLSNIGTIVQPASGTRLGQPLSGIDVPTLRDVWATAPYLHRGSAATVDAAILAHQGVSLTSTELADLVVFVKSIGREEGEVLPPPPPPPPPPVTGLRGDYFNNKRLTPPAALSRNEAVDFLWSASPGPGVNPNNFSVRWTGSVKPTTTGSYQFQTVSDDGVRLWINNVLMVDNWASHNVATNTTTPINLTAGQSYAVVMEHYDNTKDAVARLLWKTPGSGTFVAVPKDSLQP